MKKTTLIILLVIVSTMGNLITAQTPCEDNQVQGFPCSGYDLQDRLTNTQMDASFANDSWGWTDPLDGKEYALVGLSNGTAFIDISNIENQSIAEIGYFDTFPDNDNVGTAELWNVYPFFESGNLVLSGDNGFTLVKANESFDPVAGLSLFSNPATNQITLDSSQQIGKISVYNILGQELLTATATNRKELDISKLRPGFYFIQTPLDT